MKQRLSELGIYLRGVLIVVLAAAVLWQGMRLGASWWRASAIDRTVARWEEKHPKKREKKKEGEAQKPPAGKQVSAAPMPGNGMKPSGPPNMPPGARPPRKPPQPGKEKPAEEDMYAELRKGDLLGPPQPNPPPPQISAIIGDMAIIDNAEKRVGDTVRDGAKIVEIHSNKVILEKDGKRSDLVLFQPMK